MPRSRGWRPRAGAAAAALAAAWLLPVLTHALRIDAVLPPAVVLATASLLRGGRTLLDRLVLALGLLFGTATAAGLLLSVWPWGMHPVPVAGCAGSVLVVAALATGRRPRLPGPRPGDLVTLTAAAGAAAVAAWPFLRRDFPGRLSILMVYDDSARHLAVFDTIAARWHYLFVHTSEVTAAAPRSMTWYPQGSHLVYALLDAFVRSGGRPATGRDSVDHYVGFTLAGFLLLTLVVAWAVRWVGGWRLGRLRYLVPVTVAAVFCGFAEPVAEFFRGHPGEVVGLALGALAVALAARPVAATREQLVLLAAVCCGLSFTYYLFLPAVGLVVAGWLVRYRRRVWRYRWTALCCALLAGPACLVIPVGGLRAGHAEALQSQGGIMMSREFAAALLLVVAAGLAGPLARRSPVWRGYALAAGSVAVTTVAMGGYAKIRFGDPGYYFEKVLLLLMVVALVGLGSPATLLPPPARPRPGTPLRARIADALPVVALAAAVVVLTGVYDGTTPYRPNGPVHSTYGMWYARGKSADPVTYRAVTRAYAVTGYQPGRATAVLTAEPVASYLATTWLSCLQRSMGASEQLAGAQFAGQPEYLGKTLGEAPQSAGRPIQLVVSDQHVADEVAELLRRRLGRYVVVYRIPPQPSS